MNSIKRDLFCNGGGLRIKHGARYLGMAPSTFYDHLSRTSPRHDPDLPKPVSVGPNMRVLLVAEMDAYLEAKALERDEKLGSSPRSKLKSALKITHVSEQGEQP